MHSALPDYLREVVPHLSNYTWDSCYDTRDECVPYIAIALVSSILSILGSSTVIFIFFRYRQLRTTSRKIFMYVNISDIIVSLGTILSAVTHLNSGNPDYHQLGAVRVSAVVTSYGIMTSSMWTMCLSVYLIISVVYLRISLANRLLWAFHSLSWILTGFVAGFALMYRVFEYEVTYSRAAPVWDWLKPPDVIGLQWVFLTRVAWDILAFPLCLVTFTWVQVRHRKQKSLVDPAFMHAPKNLKCDGIRENDLVLDEYATPDLLTISDRANRALRFIPLMFVVTRFWGCLRVVLHTYSPAQDSSLLALLQSIGDPLQGFVNFLVFCVASETVRARLQRRLIRSGVCCYSRSAMRRRSVKLPSLSPIDTPKKTSLEEDDIMFSIEDYEDGGANNSTSYV